jgi:alkylhydroperoxidase family enzyme
MMAEQRISFVDPESYDNPAMVAEIEKCAKIGTPRPESQAVRAHRPGIMLAFADAWRHSFHEGILDNSLKELCRVYVSRSVKCEYCGNQRSEKSRSDGLVEDDYMDLLNFEKSSKYDERHKAALAYTEAITWDIQTDDALWDRLHTHFNEPELVELGFFHRANDGTAALAAHPESAASFLHGRHVGIHGTRFRGRCCEC